METLINVQQPVTVMTGDQHLIAQVKSLMDKGADEMISSLEYMITKVTTHPDKMVEADYLAAIRALDIVSFLRICKVNINPQSNNQIQL